MSITKQAGQFLVVARGLKTNLESVTKAAGQMLITTDERAVYFDIDGSTRIRIGDYQVVDCISTEDATYEAGKTVLPAADEVGTELYFVKSAKALMISDGTNWIKVSTDTGATSIVFTGGSGIAGAPATGEYVSGASYDPNTRAITFTVTKLIAQDVEYKAASGTVGESGYTAAVSVKDALDTLNGADTVEGSVAKAVKDAVESLDTAANVEIAAIDANGVVTLTKEINETDGIVDKVAGTPITFAKVATTGKAVDTEITAITGVEKNNTAATNVQDALEGLKAIADANDIYLVDESIGQNDYAKVYKLYQGIGNATSPVASELVGTINVPKDKVVKSGKVTSITFDNNKLYDLGFTTTAHVVGATPFAADWLSATEGGTAIIPVTGVVYKVVTAGTYENTMYTWNGTAYTATTTGADVTTLIKGTATPTLDDAGKYIRLELQNVDDPLFINAKDLVDIFTGSTNSEITVTVGANNEISATVNDIAASKITYIAADNTDPSNPIARESVGDALTRLDGSDTVEGSVSKKIKDAINDLDTTSDVGIASETNGVVTIKSGVKQENGLIAQGTGSDITLTKAATTGKSEDVAIDDVGGFTTATNVESALQEIYGQITWGTF